MYLIKELIRTINKTLIRRVLSFFLLVSLIFIISNVLISNYLLNKGTDYFIEIIIVSNILYFLLAAITFRTSIRKIIRPIERLTDGIQKIGIGKFDNLIETNRTDRLGLLINSFNELSHQVSNMVKSKEQIILDVGNEMRTSLSKMRLGLEVLEDQKIKNDVLTELSDLEKMISELLETEQMKSSYGEIKHEETNLIELLIDVSMQFADRKPGLRIDSSIDDIRIFADKKRLNHLFKTLIENALKYSENSTEKVLIRIFDEQLNVKIEIIDKGEGIPKDQIYFIFEPFYRVDKKSLKENGKFDLGLHLCKKIIEAHNGDISVVSENGMGTIFSLTLPKV